MEVDRTGAAKDDGTPPRRPSRNRYKLRIASWNVNGLRSICAKSGGLAGFLESFNADIVCIQETKIAKSELTQDLAIAEGWESFFSCCVGKQGYSGVATYCRIDKCMPKSCFLELAGLSSAKEDMEVSAEGRLLATDHDQFVLINIYAPAITSDALFETRKEYKLKWYKGLRARVCHLVSSGRNVLIVGDFNIAPYLIDQSHTQDGLDFYQREDRSILHSMLIENGGAFTDICRNFYPEMHKVFTCWMTATDARANNYGSRIDLALAADGESHNKSESIKFVRSFTEAKILSERKGSDHAPIFVSLSQDCPFVCGSPIPESSRNLLGDGGIQQKLTKWMVPSSACSSPAKMRLNTTQASPIRKRTSPESRKKISVQKKVKGQQDLRQFFVGTPRNTEVQERAENITIVEIAKEACEKTAELNRAAWKGLLGKMKRPLCSGHDEPCAVREVKKKGPNQGRVFYTCSRPDGPAPWGRCQYFEWVSKPVSK